MIDLDRDLDILTSHVRTLDAEAERQKEHLVDAAIEAAGKPTEANMRALRAAVVTYEAACDDLGDAINARSDARKALR